MTCPAEKYEARFNGLKKRFRPGKPKGQGATHCLKGDAAKAKNKLEGRRRMVFGKGGNRRSPLKSIGGVRSQREYSMRGRAHTVREKS